MTDLHLAQRRLPMTSRHTRRGLLRALGALAVALVAADGAGGKGKCKNKSCCNGRCVDPVDRPGLTRK